MDRDYEQVVVVASYADGSEIYKGHNMDKAKKLARAHGDKHTFYILTFDDGEITIEIERLYAKEGLDSSESMEIRCPREVKHLKTLLSLIE